MCAHAPSERAEDAGAAASAPAPAAAGAASLAAAAATSWARKARQSLSAEATGRVSGMRLPLGGWSSLLPPLAPAQTVTHRRCHEGHRGLCTAKGARRWDFLGAAELVRGRESWSFQQVCP